MTNKELQLILEKHQKWLKHEKGGKRADLHGAKLHGVKLHNTDLRGVDLHDADLHDADLHGANLTGACLYKADLHDADLHDANLHGVNLGRAELYRADLHDADLNVAYLYKADLHNADLHDADLCYADLYGADLSSVDLTGAKLHDANLHGADLYGAKLSTKEQHRLGTTLKRKMVGYKKLKNGTICKLEIPKGATVFCINGSKYRTNTVKVLEGKGISHHDTSFVYKKGKILKVKDFNMQYNIECASGIHFFKTRKEAEEYKW